MSELPPVTVLFLTYKRTQYALETIYAFKKWMVYPNLRWYVADAGSPPEHKEAVLHAIGRSDTKYHRPTEAVLSPGKNWNTGIQRMDTTLYLRLEDDFVMTKPIQLSRYVKLLTEREDVGMVRFGLMPINLEMESLGYDGAIYMHIFKTRQYCYSGNPCLVHRRFHDAYGLFNETIGPGDCEISMDHTVRNVEGPQVWWPLEMGTWGAFNHIGTAKSY